MSVVKSKRSQSKVEFEQIYFQLADNTSPIGDWKIIKIQEARLAGKEDPYDLTELMMQREETRERINAIERELSKLD